MYEESNREKKYWLIFMSGYNNIKTIKDNDYARPKKEEDEMYRAGIYSRVSIEEMGKEGEYSNSIHSQLQMAEDYIAEQGNITKAKIYVDDGVSGSNFDRPEFRRMLADIELGVIDMVIVKDVSRLGREHIDTNYYLGKYFPERQVRVVSILDNYDSRKSTYDELLEIKTLLNDMYLRDTSNKIKTVIRAKRSMGEYTPKEPPFGYFKSKEIHNHLEIDPYASEIVKRIYQLYLSGKGCKSISTILNEEGIPSPARYKKEILKTDYAWNVGKGLWSSSTVAGILKNPVYTGAIALRKFDKPSYKLKYRKQIPLEERELVADVHEAIISKEDFEQVQLIRKNNYVPHFDKNKEPHKYVGILFCGKCGTAMRKRYLASHESYDGYMCGFHQKMGEKYCEPNHITFEKLDELVAFAINQQLKHLKCDLKQLEKQYQQNKSENMTSLTKIETKINRNREYQKKAYEQFMDEVLSKEEYLELKQMYDTENQQLQIEMSKRQEAERNRQKTIEETTVWLQRLGQKKITTKQLTRDVLVELIEKIYVFPKQELDIHFKFVNPLLEAEEEAK